MFAVSGIMQAFLLLMCLIWKVRQRRLQTDAFGHPLNGEAIDQDQDENSSPNNEEGDEGHLPPVSDEEIVRAMMGEDTPLLKGGKRRKLPGRQGSSSSVGERVKGMLGKIRR